jgi:hypothetical protein
MRSRALTSTHVQSAQTQNCALNTTDCEVVSSTKLRGVPADLRGLDPHKLFHNEDLERNFLEGGMFSACLFVIISLLFSGFLSLPLSLFCLLFFPLFAT